MKISVDGKELFTLSETQKEVIKNDIPSDMFEEDVKRRLKHILIHKYENCYKRLKEEWEPKLKASGIKAIPLDDEEFAKLVFSHPHYMNRSKREEKAKINRLG